MSHKHREKKTRNTKASETRGVVGIYLRTNAETYKIVSIIINIKIRHYHT